MTPNNTATAEKSRLICSFLSGLADVYPGQAEYLREKTQDILSQKVLPTQYTDIVRQVTQSLAQDRKSWEIRNRVALDEIKELVTFAENTHSVTPNILKLSKELQNAEDPLSAVAQLTKIIKAASDEAATLRKAQPTVAPSRVEKRELAGSAIIANDISSTSRRLLSLASPLVQALVKEHPENNSIISLAKRLNGLQNNTSLDFFETILLVEDTSQQINLMLANRVNAESKFLSGVHSHLKSMHQSLNEVMQSSGVLERANGKERERLEDIMSAFKNASKDENDPFVLKKLIADNIDLMQNAVTTIIEKQAIAQRQQDRIIQKLMVEVKEQQNSIQSMQKTQFSLAQAARKAEQDSLTDTLTKVYNRRAYDEYGARLPKYVDQGADVSIIVMDIDRFKLINDTYGHDIGDKVLKKTAEILTTALHSSHIETRFNLTDAKKRLRIFRTGGEEFVIICAGVALHTACALADHVRATIESKPLKWSGSVHGKEIQEHRLNISASFGVAGFDIVNKKTDDVFILADRVMYKAKEEGRNQTWFHLDGQPKKYQPKSTPQEI